MLELKNDNYDVFSSGTIKPLDFPPKAVDFSASFWFKLTDESRMSEDPRLIYNYRVEYPSDGSRPAFELGFFFRMDRKQ